MPIRYNVFPIARLVAYTVDGTTTDEQVREFFGAVLADRRFRRGFHFAGIGSGRWPDAAYPPELAREVLARPEQFAPCRWAVVVGSGSLTSLGALEGRAGLARACGVELTPFADWSEAINWLGGATADDVSDDPPRSKQCATLPAAAPTG